MNDNVDWLEFITDSAVMLLAYFLIYKAVYWGFQYIEHYLW